MGRAYHAAAVRRRAAVALRQGACSCLRLRPGNGPASKLRTEPVSRRAPRGSGVSLANSRAPAHGSEPIGPRLPDCEQNDPMRLPDCEQNGLMRIQSRERSGPQARESERFARGFTGSPADPSAATGADQCAFRTANRTIPCAFRAASEAGRRPARASGSRADSAVPPRIHPQRPRRTNAPSERRAERSHAPSEPRAKRAAGPRERAVRPRIHPQRPERINAPSGLRTERSHAPSEPRERAVRARIHPQRPERINAPLERRAERSHAPSEPRAERAAGPRERAVRARIHRFARGFIRSDCGGPMRLPDCEQNGPMRLQCRERSERFARGSIRSDCGGPMRHSNGEQNDPMRLQSRERSERFARGSIRSDCGGPMRHSNGEQNDPMRLQSRERSGPQARGSERFARGFSGSPADPSAATAADQCAPRTASGTIPCAFRAASEAGRRPARASGSRADSAVRPRIHPQRPERTNAPSGLRTERSHAPSEPRAKRAAGPGERAVRARIQRFARGFIRDIRSTPPISPSRLRRVSLLFSAPSSRISPSPLRKSFSVSPAGLSRAAAVRRLRPSARLPHGSPGSAHGACP